MEKRALRRYDHPANPIPMRIEPDHCVPADRATEFGRLAVERRRFGNVIGRAARIASEIEYLHPQPTPKPGLCFLNSPGNF
jgi:hypothetical protein